jgi:1,4-dihydroxy-6-naphthoate synthase
MTSEQVKPLRIAYSPCPNDTFTFDALASPAPPCPT